MPNSNTLVLACQWKTLTEMFMRGMTCHFQIGGLARQLFIFFQRNVLEPIARADREMAIMREIKKAQTEGKSRQFCKTLFETLSKKDLAIPWTCYGLIYHLMYHNNDPEILRLVCLWEISLMRKTVSQNMCYERHDQSGRVVLVEDGYKLYERLTKQHFDLHKLKIDKMTLYNKTRGDIVYNGQSLLNQNKPGIVHDTFRVARKDVGFS